MWEVKVTAMFYLRIKHASFPSLCIGEIHRTVLEYICVGYWWG